MSTEPITMDSILDSIRAAAERLIHEAALHRAEYTDGADLTDLVDDILIVGPAALAGLDLYAENVQLRTENECLRSKFAAMSG